LSNLQKAIVIGCAVIGDGVNDTFELDLLRDPYFISFHGNGFGEFPADWFSESLLRNQPVGVAADSPDSATLTDNVVTYTFGTAPASGTQGVSFTLLF
jgi:hypothetical protein